MTTAFVLDIRHDSVVDGPGLRSVVFFAGCPHHCLGCHNPDSWIRENGSEQPVSAIIDTLLQNPLSDVTLSGGEPFEQAQAAGLIAKACQKAGKDVWVFTGWTLEALLDRDDPATDLLLVNTDTLVDGPYEQNNPDTGPAFRGSTNQRILTGPFRKPHVLFPPL
ncbi:4Fe-4S cluster-binding domain-containing protein [Salisediminibacterium selenitireducens]|uniref:Anaerobic ribonucleoside-triphosphate reductase-activating protein n=1 Tax=Bacillus selenitireducens (strain ATCC 700615 / DSM 15326 / MLS10) TaxID=439292 RepID=D6XWK0_BACIE|nr:4Fe-4S cluster-binding domain-containing protein [Salisediminibacterium selenitireducens]ADH97842.1 anaerobic ribonucleoside-triphosphate reductase activating protein [[Bacillus] selenitireducens MLS10]